MILVRLVSPRAVVVLLDEQHAGELTVGAGGGLEGHAVHAGDLAEILPGGVQHLLAARPWRAPEPGDGRR